MRSEGGLTRRWPEGLCLTVVSVGLTVWWLWPLPRVWFTHSAHFAGDFQASIADYYLIVWVWAWDAHALVTRPWDLFHANSYYPSTLSLAYSEHFLGYVPLFAPAYWITGNPIFAANLVVFLTYPLCVLAMWAFARRYVGGPAAAVAGFFYAFSLYRYAAPPNMHMLGVQYMPLVLLATERWFERARWADAIFLAGALLLQLLSSVYLAYGFGLVYAPYLAFALWRWRRQLDRRRLLGLAAAGGFAVGVMGLFMLPYLRLRDLGLIKSYGDDNLPLGLMPSYVSPLVWKYLQGQGLGWVGYALAALALLPPWPRGRRWPLVVGLVIALVGTLGAFGPGILVGGHVLWSPYALLLAWVPGFSSVRLSARFVVIAHAGFALLAGLGVARLLDCPPARFAWPAAAALAAAALWSFAPYAALPLHEELTEARVPGAYRWLGQHGEGRALFEIPGKFFAISARRQYLSSYHWLPVVDGYSGYAPGTADYLHWVSRDLPAAPALQELVDWADIGWILVHRDLLPPHEQAAWAMPLPPGLERVGVWGYDHLFRVSLPVHDDRRARLLSSTETLSGVPLAPLGDTCPGVLRILVPPPVPWRWRDEAHVIVEAENTGTMAWPATGFYPRHLVRIHGTLIDPDGVRLVNVFQDLTADVLPGGKAHSSLIFTAPLRVGTYALEVELIQVGDGVLTRCGVAPLRIPVRIG